MKNLQKIRLFMFMSLVLSIGDIFSMSSDDVDNQDAKNQALLHAVNYGDEYGVQQVLNAGADVNAQGIFNETALHLAVRKNYKNVAITLIESFANLNMQDYFGETPLFVAIKKNNLDMVELLVSAGADIAIKNNNQDTPMSIAIFYGNQKIIDFLRNPYIQFIDSPAGVNLNLDFNHAEQF